MAGTHRNVTWGSNHVRRGATLAGRERRRWPDDHHQNMRASKSSHDPQEEIVCTPTGVILKLPEVLAQRVSDGDGLTVMKVLRIHVHAMVAGIAEFNGW